MKPKRVEIARQLAAVTTVKDASRTPIPRLTHPESHGEDDKSYCRMQARCQNAATTCIYSSVVINAEIVRALVRSLRKYEANKTKMTGSGGP